MLEDFRQIAPGLQHLSYLDPTTDGEQNVDFGGMLDEPRQITPPSSGQEHPCLDPPVETATVAENLQLLKEVQECYNALLKNQDEIQRNEALLKY